MSSERLYSESESEETEKEKKVINKSEEEFPTITLSKPLRWIIFIALTTVSISSSIDGGIIPAATDRMKSKEEMDISDSLFGLLSSIDYLGRTIGSLIFVAIINTTNRRMLLIATLLFKAGTLFISFFSKNYWPNLIGRGISGLSQVYYTTYLPVWCDQYGPKKAKTLMITIVQLGNPLGIVIGFGIETLLENWKRSFQIEGMILVSLAVLLLWFPSIYFSTTLRLIDDKNAMAKELTQEELEAEEAADKGEEIAPDEANDGDNKEEIVKVDQDNKQPSSLFKEGKGNAKRKSTLLGNWKHILSEMVFLFTVWSLSVIFFGTAIIQFWGANYMINVLKLGTNELFWCFSVVCVTGPPIGIMLGGITGTFVGGYTKKICIKICIGLAILAYGFSSILGLFNEKTKYGYIVGIWMFFFFGGAMIPLETGIVISSLPKKFRGDGSSVMNFALNLFGNLPAAFAYGVIAEQTTNKKIPMICTMNYIFMALVFVIIATVFRLRKPDDSEEENEVAKKQVTDEENKIKSEKKKSFDDPELIKQIGRNISQAYGSHAHPDPVSQVEEKEDEEKGE